MFNIKLIFTDIDQNFVLWIFFCNLIYGQIKTYRIDVKSYTNKRLKNC